jgi:hypothetical protein
LNFFSVGIELKLSLIFFATKRMKNIWNRRSDVLLIVIDENKENLNQTIKRKNLRLAFLGQHFVDISY